MAQTRRFVILAAAVGLAAPLAPVIGDGAGTAGASNGGTTIAFSQMLRRCDFSETDFNGPTGFARTLGTVRTDGSTVTADLQIATAIPNTHYDVRLIQVPRPSSATCHAGDPGVTAGALNTDGVGAASTTVQGAVEPSATGVWVFISRPDAFSQNPAEFYTSDFIVPV
ncbi:hypothetical protein [Mycolicibacterium sp. XJ1819]